ncbi:MAG: hypothetical protein AAGF94_20225 [Pseudomonadota bacterium]
MSKEKQNQSCFFVTPIGQTGSQDRKRADDVLKHVLRPALGDGFKIVRADEVDDPGTITGDIVARLYNSDLVVADLTGTNPNVMYEAGIRHSFSKPIVQICQTGETLPFDLADERTIFFDVASLDEVSEAKERIEKAARRALDARPFRSPVVRALEFDTLFSDATKTPLSRNLIEKLDDLSNTLDEVKSDVAYLETSVAHMEISVETPELSVLNELAEFLSKFDYIGPSEVRDLARAAKEIVQKHKNKTD